MSQAYNIQAEKQLNLTDEPLASQHSTSAKDCVFTESEEFVWRQNEIKPGQIIIDRSRDKLLTKFGQVTLDDRYLLPGESYQDLFARVACAYADNEEHAQRLYDYISKLWFMPSTPILNNGGTNRVLPISCFLNEVQDSLKGIMDNLEENLWLSANAGGIGTYWGNVRSSGEIVEGKGITTPGVIPFLRLTDSLMLAISRSMRRGAAAVYLDIYHPEIEEFLEIRKPSGDFNRKCLNLHHAILITDKFMNAVECDQSFNLVSPKTGKIMRTVNARSLWQKILETRLQTGEPYLIFKDTANRLRPRHHKELGLEIKMSNLCSEIYLPTGKDHLGNMRTAVCCLSSVNVNKWDDWKDKENFIEDIMRFLDNVLQDFINRANDKMQAAKYSAMRERAVGLGVLGFHSFLMQKKIPFDSLLAKSFNLKLFKYIKQHVDMASYVLAKEKGACPDAKECNMQARFSYKTAIAPTATISIIAGGESAGVEPIPANIYTHKTLSGSFSVKNPYLKKILQSKNKDNQSTWNSILENNGSVQHLDILTSDEKSVFKTAFEIDQRWIIELAGDRSPYICQGQSINLFLDPDINKWDLMMLHRLAWKKGLKGLYYSRSLSIQRAQFVGINLDKTGNKKMQNNDKDYEECLSCQ